MTIVQMITGVHSGSRQLGKSQTGKDQFHEKCPVVRDQATQTCDSRVAPRCRVPAKPKPEQIFSSRCQWNRHRQQSPGKLFFSDGNSGLHQVNGGARRDRTDDLLNANQALSQLSYGPNRRGTPGKAGPGAHFSALR